MRFSESLGTIFPRYSNEIATKISTQIFHRRLFEKNVLVVIPLPLKAYGSQVHLATDETWLIAVAVPAKRPACLGSHVALRLLSDRFIFRFLHLHPSSSFTPSRRPTLSSSLLSLVLLLSLPSYPVPYTTSSPLVISFSLSLFYCDCRSLIAPVSPSKCAPRMRNSRSDM